MNVDSINDPKSTFCCCINQSFMGVNKQFDPFIRVILKTTVTKTSRTINIDLVIIPDAKIPISGTSSKSQSKTKNDGEACPTKKKFTEGHQSIIWLPTLLMQKTKVMKKQNLENKDKILGEPNVSKLNDRAISN